MTGYESKKAAARDKLAQPEQAKLMQDAFDEWWDSNHHSLNEINPCIVDSFEYWAWEGWHAALAQPAPTQLLAHIKFLEDEIRARGEA